jgi:putative ABC transport system substrate-binding protein
MQRREFIAGLGSAAAWPVVAWAQQRTRLPLIGVLWSNPTPFPMANFRQGLGDQGLVIGENVAIDFEFPFQFSQLPAGAAALVERHVDVIFVAPSWGPVRAAKAATATIPIVFFYDGDPVEDGFVVSLSHPGGNVTGMAGQGTELLNKRLGLLHELVPGAKTIAFLTGTALSPSTRGSRDHVLAAAHSLGLNLLIEDVNGRDIERVFMGIAEHHVEALIVENAPFPDIRRIIALAERYKLPAMYPYRNQVRSGGLISYSTDLPSLRLAAARYVAPILKGAKPADLPVQQPTKFELVINLKTAKALGIEVPETLLAIADEVIDDPLLGSTLVPILGWNSVPTITVVSGASDPRLPLVRDAVAFWNSTLSELGSGFRLGALTQMVGTIPVDDLKNLRLPVLELPESVRRIKGNIAIVLSDSSEFLSFSGGRATDGKVMVAIKDSGSFPLTLPNVARNVIAHELGHAIGLRHNSDPTTLMCSCRPVVFRSDQPRMFPLTDDEKRQLLTMYPSQWKPQSL